MFLFFFKQKTAYEMRISDWSSDVCSSDLDAMTVIADDAGVHDIAGIMGGEHSGCSETTTDILLEIAWFTPERIALTGQALGLASDARSRLDRKSAGEGKSVQYVYIPVVAVSLKKKIIPSPSQNKQP